MFVFQVFQAKICIKLHNGLLNLYPTQFLQTFPILLSTQPMRSFLYDSSIVESSYMRYLPPLDLVVKLTQIL